MSTQQATREVRQNPAYGAIVRVGLVAYGIVHLAIAWIAANLAFGNNNEQPSQQGAMRELGQTPLGGFLLWVVGLGLFALALWQLILALSAYHDPDAKKRYAKRFKSVAKAVVYIVLGVNAIEVALGSGGGGGSGSARSATATLMSAPAGRALVAVVGLVILGIGFYHVYKAATAGFKDDLVGGVGTPTMALGRAGYASKGVAMSIVGVLFVWAAISYDPNVAGGLDTALRRVKDAPAGPFLLTLVAIGIACFGVYCFAWARKVRR